MFPTSRFFVRVCLIWRVGHNFLAPRATLPTCLKSLIQTTCRRRRDQVVFIFESSNFLYRNWRLWIKPYLKRVLLMLGKVFKRKPLEWFRVYMSLPKNILTIPIYLGVAQHVTRQESLLKSQVIYQLRAAMAISNGSNNNLLNILVYSQNQEDYMRCQDMLCSILEPEWYVTNKSLSWLVATNTFLLL